MSALDNLFMAAGLPGDEDETSAQLQQQVRDLVKNMIDAEYKEISESHMIGLVSGDGGAHTLAESLKRKVEKL